MEIKNNKEEVPFEHYLQSFRQMDPEDAVRRLEIPLSDGVFAVVQDYRIRISVWEADEEFGPNAQTTFSDNFAAGFPVEDCVAAAELLTGAICAAMA